MSSMAKVYAILVRKGEKTLDQVPAIFIICFFFFFELMGKSI